MVESAQRSPSRVMHVGAVVMGYRRVRDRSAVGITKAEKKCPRRLD